MVTTKYTKENVLTSNDFFSRPVKMKIDECDGMKKVFIQDF